METETPPTPPLPPGPASSETTSLWARMFNIFAAPGEVYDEVRQSPPCHANWLVPVLLSCLVGLAAVQVLFSQPAILHQVRQQQQMAIEKKLQHLPQEQREQIMTSAEKFTTPLVLKLFGSAGAVGGTFAWLFFLSLVLWLIGKFAFKADCLFVKALEVCGLALMIGLLGAILGTLLAVGKGQLMVSPGPMLLIKDFDPANKLHQSLAGMNLVTLWQIVVLSIGLGRLGNRSWLRALPWLLIPWAVFKFGLIWLGVGGMK